MKLLVRIAIIVFALLLVSKLSIGVEVQNLTVAIFAAVALGLLNAVIRPILVILTLPITILTLGLFILFINATLFYLTANFIDGFSVTSFTAAFIGSILVSIISLICNRFLA